MRGFPVVSSSALRPIVDFMNQSGISVDRYFNRAQIPRQASNSDDLLVPEQCIGQLFLDLREREGTSDIGFRMLSAQSLINIPGVHSAVTPSSTLLDALTGYAKSRASLTNHPGDYFLSLEDDEAVFCRKAPPLNHGLWVLEQCAVAGMIKLVGLAMGDDWKPERIGLMHTAPLESAENEWLEGCTLNSGQSCTSIVIPPEALSQTIGSRHSGSPGQEALELALNVHGITAACLQECLEIPVVRLDDFCRLVNVSPRTLQRWLKEEKSSFQGILNEVRFEKSLGLIRSGEFRISEIASMLGYKSPAAFTRAFIKWTGKPPSAFRSIH